MAEPDPMNYFEASIILVFGVILPTVDIGSDVYIAIILLVGEPLLVCSFHLLKSELYTYGAITLIFPIISFLFTTNHWWRMEKKSAEGGSGRMRTLVLLGLQIWPQYRMVRLLYLGLVKKCPSWRREHQNLLHNVTSVEPFTESVPQIYWILCVWVLTGGCLGPIGDWHYYGQSIKLNYPGLISFSSSILSASYGLTNFFRTGPLKAIPNQPASGFGHLSFPLIFFSIASTLVTKGIVLVYVLGFYFYEDTRNIETTICFSLSLLFVIQLLLAFVSLFTAVGLKDSFRLAVRFPSIILTPIFSPYVFGPENSNCGCILPNKIRMHHGLTALNFVITALSIPGLHFFILDSQEGALSEEDEREDIWTDWWYNWIILKYGLPVYVVGVLCTSILMLIDLRSHCCRPIRHVSTAKELLNDIKASNDDVEMAVIGDIRPR